MHIICSYLLKCTCLTRSHFYSSVYNHSPKERALRKNQEVEEDTTRSDPVATKESKDYSEYFLEMDKMRWAERQREMKRMAIERAKKQRDAQEQRTSENVVVDQSVDDLQVVNEVQEEEPQPTKTEPQEGQENESSQEAIDMDEYGLLEREFSTEYDISEQSEEVQEVATEVEFSTEYDISEHLGEEEEVEDPQRQESQEESNTESDISEERADNALQRAIAMLRRIERPK